jgi:hypothetical protein
VVGNFKEHITHEVEVLREMIEGKDAPAAVEEPIIPASSERFLNQPAS